MNANLQAGPGFVMLSFQEQGMAFQVRLHVGDIDFLCSSIRAEKAKAIDLLKQQEETSAQAAQAAQAAEERFAVTPAGLQQLIDQGKPSKRSNGARKRA